MKSTAAVGAVAGIGGLTLVAAQDTVPTFELGGKTSGWIGRTPSSIQGEVNPTLEMQPGTEYTVIWENIDGALHNFVIQDADGNQLVQTDLMNQQGQTQSVTFTATSEMTEYYCEAHPTTMRGQVNVSSGDTETTPTTTETPTDTTPNPSQNESPVIRVPSDYSTIQAAVDNAEDGDLVLIDAGTYNESVAVSTSGITIRGVNRNEVVLDGEFERSYGIDIEGANGVAVENLTARHYTETAIYWDGVDGFRGSYLTAYNNGQYGIYAYESVDGRFERSYASGHPDSGFYLGHNNPFHAIITDVLAENNALGFSGTSAGGDLTIKNSVWRRNMAGIVPNTLDKSNPQNSIHMVNNLVHDNNNDDAPAKPLTYPALGTGILLTGANKNTVEENDVRNHMNFGIALKELVGVAPSGNEVRKNMIGESGIADIGVGKPVGEGNVFFDNDCETSLPPSICEMSHQGPYVVEEGSAKVNKVYTAQGKRAQQKPVPWGNWETAPEPEDRPTMANPDAAPVAADKDSSVVGPGMPALSTVEGEGPDDADEEFDGSDDEDNDGDGAVDEDDEANVGPSNDDDDGDGAIDEDDELDDGDDDDATDDTDDDGDGHVDEDDESDDGDDDDIDDDGDGHIDEDDEAEDDD